MTCSTAGCQRAARTTATGLVMAHCDACTRRVLRDAFASEPASAEGVSTPIPPSGTRHAPRSSGPADPATHAPASLAVTQASPAH